MIIDIPKNVGTIISVLEKQGYEAYIVGGCIRDSLLGKQPKDWDITTNALPAETTNCFCDYTIIETGLQHGTVTIVIDKEQYEITTYRIDGEYSDNRRPNSVEFTPSLEEDLKRRDFTINAMAYNPKSGIVDIFNSKNDIDGGIIRCVGDANDRFQEDSLRIMRAIRFASVLRFSIASETKDAMRQNKILLKNISKERVHDEFAKILNGSLAHYELLLYNDIIGEVLPEIIDMVGFKQNNPYHVYDVYQHTVKTIEAAPQDLAIRLALYFHDIGKPSCYSEDENGTGHFYRHAEISSNITKNIMTRLKFDNETIKNVVELIGYHDAEFITDNKHTKGWLNKIGEQQFRRLLEVKRCDIKAQNPAYINDRILKIDKMEETIDEVLSKEECFQLKDLAITGSDLITIGVKEGKKIGAILNTLLEMVISESVQNDKNSLMEKVNSIITINLH